MVKQLRVAQQASAVDNVIQNLHREDTLRSASPHDFQQETLITELQQEVGYLQKRLAEQEQQYRTLAIQASTLQAANSHVKDIVVTESKEFKRCLREKSILEAELHRANMSLAEQTDENSHLRALLQRLQAGKGESETAWQKRYQELAQTTRTQLAEREATNRALLGELKRAGGSVQPASMRYRPNESGAPPRYEDVLGSFEIDSPPGAASLKPSTQTEQSSSQESESSGSSDPFSFGQQPSRVGSVTKVG